MSNKTKSSEKLTQKQIEEEIKMLSDASKKKSSKQLDLVSGIKLEDEDIDKGFDVARLQGTADPDKSHRIYYTMRRIMTDNLPKGKENKKLRQHIYDEKSLFLNRGIHKNDYGIKGSDERMAYIDGFLQTAFEVVFNWVKSGGTPYDLYQLFYNLNEEKGYHVKD